MVEIALHVEKEWSKSTHFELCDKALNIEQGHRHFGATAVAHRELAECRVCPMQAHTLGQATDVADLLRLHVCFLPWIWKYMPLLEGIFGCVLVQLTDLASLARLDGSGAWSSEMRGR